MQVRIVTVTSWSGEGEPVASTSIQGVFANQADARAWINNNGPWSAWREFEIDCFPVQ